MTITDTTIDTARHERVYRVLLRAYPRSFRLEYGDDLQQAFRDLFLLSARQGRGTGSAWLRSLRDLATSAPRQHREAGSGRPLGAALAVAAAVALVVGVQSPEALAVYAVLASLTVLPIVSAVLLRRAFVRHRTTGERVWPTVLGALLALVPALATVALVGRDLGWYLLMAGAILVIGGSVVGAVWAVSVLASGRAGRGRRALAIAGVVAALLVLGTISLGGYNSYRYNQGPPGDHSVANASAESLALWEAAAAGDVAEVERLAATCADPWVQFPYGNGKHRAKGIADQRILELPDEEEGPYAEIMAITKDAEQSWYDRCGDTD